jgi:SpoVK/Ycf46/Vps4 family AAA+-type ATPase
MSSTKPPEFINYKFKDLKVYASTEWLADSKKKYRRVFDRSEITYLYAEFSFYNKLFDEDDWKTKINLKAFSLDGNKRKELCNVEVPLEVTKDKNIVFIREGWGMDKAGAFWKEGKYLWEASIDETFVASKEFYVYDVGEVTVEANPFFTIEAVRLYEGPYAGTKKEERTYYTHFSGKDARYIWAEFKGKNLLDKEWMCELIFQFYNDARQLKGISTELQKIPPGQASFEITSGWGSDFKGTWYTDNYTVEIVFKDRLIAVVPFRVGEMYMEGDPPLLQPEPDSDGTLGLGVRPAQSMDEASLEEVMAELDGLIGLETIKREVKEYSQYLNFLKLRQEKGFEDTQKISLHAVFTGNPGTGKTTVALLLGKIYHKMGLLSKGHVHEVDRGDIVGEYIGQTAPKVKDAIEKARGGILFIDEAYALARSEDDTKDYGREVIEILVKEMSDGKGDLALIVAGYPKEMENFLNSNPGIKSRFNMHYHFPDYTPDELFEIAKYSADKRKVTIAEEASEYLLKKVVDAYRSRDRSFGNARFVNALIDESKMNLGLRVMRTEDPGKLSNEELSTITLEDVTPIFEPIGSKKAKIPVDQDLLQDALDELHKLIGLASVKSEVHELVKLVKFYKEEGRDVLNRFSLHTVFVGNPGTGKTTVARILGKLFKSLGILERGEVVEVDRQQLVGGYIGQTAIKTAEVIERARGSVLFIDEAYALAEGGPQDYGKEAVETILKRMEDMRGELIVIVAGYPDNMRTFLESNPGLRSRFDRKIEFEDYSPAELVDIAEMMLKQEGIVAEKAAMAQISEYLTHLHRNRNKFFGNARAVRKVVEKSIKNQHLRLASMEPGQRTDAIKKTITLADVLEFEKGNDSLLEGGNQGVIGFGL